MFRIDKSKLEVNSTGSSDERCWTLCYGRDFTSRETISILITTRLSSEILPITHLQGVGLDSPTEENDVVHVAKIVSLFENGA